MQFFVQYYNCAAVKKFSSHHMSLVQPCNSESLLPMHDVFAIALLLYISAARFCISLSLCVCVCVCVCIYLRAFNGSICYFVQICDVDLSSILQPAVCSLWYVPLWREYTVVTIACYLMSEVSEFIELLINSRNTTFELLCDISQFTLLID